MTKEQKYILQVIADHLQRQYTAPPNVDLDWATVQRYAHNHQIEGVLYHQCKEFIPNAKKWQAAYFSTVFYYTNRIQFMSQLKEILQIPWFAIKGSSVAAFYPIPMLRTMGDTDIVVHTEDRENAHNAMMALGFRNDSKFTDREWVYYKNNMEFEIHDHLVYSETINQTVHERFFNDYWKYVKNGELDWNFHFLFLVLHLRKHLMNSGVGFRQFMDLAVLVLYNKELDWKWIKEELEKLNLLDFSKVSFAFIEKWFGVKAPFGVEPLNKEFYESATAKIFEDGIFGFDNDENKDATAVNEARAGKNKYTMAIRKVFPAYKTLITIPHYSFLCGKPYLLPVVWFYRILRGIMRKRTGAAIRNVKKSFADSDVIEARSYMLEQWGL